MTRAVTFIVPGEPVAKGRPRFSTRGGKTRTYTPTKTAEAEWSIRLYAVAAFGNQEVFDGPVRVRLVFVLRRPKSVSAKKRPWPSVKPDVDNLAKTVLDALSAAVAWIDDSLVCILEVEKMYASLEEEPRTVIHIEEL